MTLELDESFDVAKRQLCPDGSCTGVLDDAGVCKVCGAQGTPPLQMATEGSDGAGDLALPFDEVVSDAPAGSRDANADAKATGDASFDEDRTLCPDGSCIGVLGSDGRCKVCGRSPA